MRIRHAVLGILVLLISACGDGITAPVDEASALAASQARWAGSGVTNYRYTVLRACECEPESTLPIVVEVLRGQVQQRTYAASGSPVNAVYAAGFPTVPGLFDLIQEALALPAAGIAVRYEGTFGYPVSIQIDYVAGVAADELTYRISEFEPLP